MPAMADGAKALEQGEIRIFFRAVTRTAASKRKGRPIGYGAAFSLRFSYGVPKRIYAPQRPLPALTLLFTFMVDSFLRLEFSLAGANSDLTAD
jgi:hypothetical protein